MAPPVDNFAESASLSQIMPPRPINGNVLYPGCKETLSPVIFRKICGPHWNRVISMILALRNNSATWFKKYNFKSSAIDTRYLVSLAIYFRWYGFLENFFASSSLQQFQVKSSRSASELKLLSFWKTTPPPRKPWKTKPREFISYFNRDNNRAKVDYWAGRKTLLYFRLYGLMTWI